MKVKPILWSAVIGVAGLSLAGCEGGYGAGVGVSGGEAISGPPPAPYAQGPAQPVYPDQPAPYPDQPAPYAEQPGQPGPAVDVNVFYNDLAPYGRWENVPQYGRVFVPANIGPDWQPYTVGHWEYTDYGWTWVSDEPFGWATFHYGGWAFQAGIGWFWAPGRTWGPAWVAWRRGDGFCGWAPLPPHHGVDINVNIINEIPPDRFRFVHERDVIDPHIRQHFVNVRENRTIINRTTNVTNIRVENHRVVNNSLDVRRVEQATGRRIEPKVIRPANHPTEAHVQGNEVRVYRPAARSENHRPAARGGTPQNRPEERTAPRTAPPERVAPRPDQRSAPQTTPPERLTPRPEERTAPRTTPEDHRTQAERQRLEQQQHNQQQLDQRNQQQRLEQQRLEQQRSQQQRLDQQRNDQQRLDQQRRQQQDAQRERLQQQNAQRERLQQQERQRPEPLRTPAQPNPRAEQARQQAEQRQAEQRQAQQQREAEQRRAQEQRNMSSGNANELRDRQQAEQRTRQEQQRREQESRREQGQGR